MMKALTIALALVLSQGVLAHELDNEAQLTAKQIELAKDLPQTVVIRTDKKTGETEVVHLKEKLAPGKKVANLKFEKIAMNAEVTGIAFDSKNEKDITSSTSSWGFAIGGWGRRGYAYGGASPYYRGYYGYNGGYYGGYGYYNPYYTSYYNNCGYYNNCYYPNYNYYGVNYGYTPYYGYSDNCYNYAYFGYRGGAWVY
jgi:hypothetical protein